MKKTLFLFYLIGLAGIGFSQITLGSGSQMIINTNKTVTAVDVINNGGTIDLVGTAVIEIKGNLENNISGLVTTGSTGTVKFNGSSVQEVTGGHDAEFYGILEINNSAGISITNTTTGSSQTINGTLLFSNGLFTLNGFDLTMGTDDAIGVGSTKYVRTNSTGVVTRNVPADGTTNIFFPVGKSAFNPVTLQNSATATSDEYGVRVIDAELSGATHHFVNRGWIISEGTSGGSELTITPQWNGTEELTDFDNSNCNVGLTNDNGATYTWTTTGAATGTDPYTKSGLTFNNVGTFSIGDYFVAGKRLDLKLFLAGAYSRGTMTQTLFTKGLIPLNDPYGLGISVTSVPTNAVDWVVVRLRDKTNSSNILKEFAFFVDPNGDLINTDGTLGGILTGFAIDEYYVEVNHRNHNGIMTLNTIDLIPPDPMFDFTTNTDVYGTNPQADLDGGVYGLRKGNVNGDGRISKFGPVSINDYSALLNIIGTNSFLLDIYSGGDINMDGNVRKFGPTAINDYSALLNSLGVNSFIIEQLP